MAACVWLLICTYILRDFRRLLLIIYALLAAVLILVAVTAISSIDFTSTKRR